MKTPIKPKPKNSAEAEYASGALMLFRPPPLLSVAEWAEKFRVLSRGATSEPGRYRCDRVPYQRGIMDAFTDVTVRETVLCIASQIGKTELLSNLVGYLIHAHPSPILIKYPTLDAAKGYSKEKLDPMIDATPVLRERIREARSRDSGNTILQKSFPGGFIRIAGANSPSGLRRASCRAVLQDEIDSDPPSAGSEGDPVALADRRASNFSDAIFVKMSTPTIRGQSRIWRLLEDSDYQTWRAVCPHCNQAQELAWANVRWETGEDGKGKPETAYYAAECGCTWNDMDRQRAIMRGHWEARQPFVGRRGYHVSGLYKLMGAKPQFKSMLHEFVVDFLEAKKAGPERMKTWVNTFLAEPSEEDTFEKLDEKAIMARAEGYEPDVCMPAGVLRIEVGVDVQQDRVELEFVGYGDAEETWGLGYHVLHGDTQAAEVWGELDTLLTKTFPTACGRRIGVTTTFIDSGDRQDRVLQFTGPRRTRGIFASKGLNTPGKQVPILPRKPSINNKRKVPQWMVGVTAAKTVVYSRIMLPVPGPGSMHFPKGHGYDARFFRQLTSERKKLRYSHGRPYYIFEADKRRNEPLDIRVYSLAAHRRTPFDAEQARKALDALPIVGPVTPDVTAAADWKAGLVEVAPAPSAETPAQKPKQPASGVKLPAYVPMSQRIKGRAFLFGG